jgi:surfactin synthase thioesterase subunit
MRPNPWFFIPKKNPEARFRGWAACLPEVELAGVQLPGRESRFAEALIDDAHTAARAIAQSLLELDDSRPNVFFGHSLGASLAYEVAQLLWQGGSAHAPRHVIVSGRRAPTVARREKPLHLLPPDELKRELQDLNCTPPEILENDELMDMLMPRLRADFAMAENYRHSHGVPLPCPVSAFGGRSDKDVNRADIEAWGPLTNGEFSVSEFDGDHFFLHGSERAVLARLRTILDPLLACA